LAAFFATIYKKIVDIKSRVFYFQLWGDEKFIDRAGVQWLAGYAAVPLSLIVMRRDAEDAGEVKGSAPDSQTPPLLRLRNHRSS
jgi:hypothetical protein